MKSWIRLGFKCNANLSIDPDPGDIPEIYCMKKPAQYWCYCTPRRKTYFGRCRNHPYVWRNNPKAVDVRIYQITRAEAMIAEVMES